jgi:hypothetical protein
MFLLSHVSSSKKSENKRAEHVLPGCEGEPRGRWEVTPAMYLHVSKCKNDKIKKE